MARIVADLKDLRESEEITQREIAEKLGITDPDVIGKMQSQISRYETNTSDPDSLPVRLVAAYLEACGSDIATFFEQYLSAQEMERRASTNEEVCALRKIFNQALRSSSQRERLKDAFRLAFASAARRRKRKK